MQFTAVWIKRYIINGFGSVWDSITGSTTGSTGSTSSMSLNDVCCYIPAWFGVLASIIVGLIAHEVSLDCNTQRTIGHVIQDWMRGDAVTGVAWEQEEKEGEEGVVAIQQDQGGGSTAKTTTTTTTRPMYLFGTYSSPALECGVFAMGIMGMVPAHLTRSVGGGFDNESVAVSALCLTFYFWVRSLRSGDKHGYLYGILTGLSYFYVSAL
jgi:dolichyl-diphosphooligosaccharide--protein glycosyltransferase